MKTKVGCFSLARNASLAYCYVMFIKLSPSNILVFQDTQFAQCFIHTFDATLFFIACFLKVF